MPETMTVVQLWDLFESGSTQEIVKTLKPSTLIENASVARVIGRWMTGGVSRLEVLKTLSES